MEICFTILPALIPALYPLITKLGPPIAEWLIKQYRHLADWLEEILEPFDGIRSIIFGAVGMASVIWLFVFTNLYNKWDARWWNAPVWFVALVAGLLAMLWLIISRWFNNLKKVTEWATMFVLGVSLISSTLMGIVFTENGTHNTAYSYYDTPSGSTWYYYSTGQYYQTYGATSTTDSDTDDSDDGVGFIIIVGLAIVLASAIIPHFWFAGGVILISMMLVVCLRELLRQSKYGFDWGVLQQHE